MPLPFDLQFSQGSLQDFVDCRRRFELRHVLRRAWPAIEVEPALENELHLRQGELFHRMIQQHVLGVPVDLISPMALGGDLGQWWQNYLASAPADLPGAKHPEVTLSAPLGDYRLVAKVDLVIVMPEGQAIIFDWKTSRKRSKRQWLASRLQTRVYPYLLVEAGAELNSGLPIAPDQVEMIYWFANYSADPEHFPYNADLHRDTAAYLASLLDEMVRLGDTETDWPMTLERDRCRFCVYRSLCDRGVQPGTLDEVEDAEEIGGDALIDLDFEQIAEIEY